MKLYSLFMEGDFGQDRTVFTTKEKAREYASKVYELQMGKDEDLEEDDKFENFWEGYCGTYPLEVDP